MGTEVRHHDRDGFATGLRAFFEYRDLGVRGATGGRFGAHVIRAIPGRRTDGSWHRHRLDFQFVVVLSGEVTFDYEDIGRVTLRAGSTVLQPPLIRHREVGHSDDLELIEITSPAEFETETVDPPWDVPPNLRPETAR
ncbi:MAG: cupin domain-containing protein [Rhodovarius sp.]|nr:cupin domain-containing protein [Rhodovarius sp.]MCX7931735.1 cupin domain-containing protein [Rhodovarius sp.]MDW8316120.1 cupin domain-containing protein [Rhodovarius sp.]